MVKEVCGMNTIGTRIYFDSISKQVIMVSGEMSGEFVENRPIEDIQYVDIPYGDFNFAKHVLVGIDDNHQPIIENIDDVKTQLPVDQIKDVDKEI